MATVEIKNLPTLALVAGTMFEVQGPAPEYYSGKTNVEELAAFFSQITVQEAGVDVATGVTTFNFEGATVTETSPGVVKVEVAAALAVEDSGAPVETGVSVINFTGNAAVTNPSPGQVDVDITGSSGGTFTIQLRPYDNEPPTSNFATLDFRNNHPVLDFDDTTQEGAVFSFQMPNDYAGGGLIVSLWWAMTTATTGTCGWDISFERDAAGGIDIDTDNFAAANTVGPTNVPATSGVLTDNQAAIANGANMANIVANDMARIRIRRTPATDTAVGDAELLLVTIREN